MTSFLRVTMPLQKKLMERGLNAAQRDMLYVLAADLHYKHNDEPVRMTVKAMARRYARERKLVMSCVTAYITAGFIKKENHDISLTEYAISTLFSDENTVPKADRHGPKDGPFGPKSGPPRSEKGTKRSLCLTMKTEQSSLDQNRSEKNDSDFIKSESRALADAGTIGLGWEMYEGKRQPSWLVVKLKAKQNAKQEKEARDKQDDHSIE